MAAPRDYYLTDEQGEQVLNSLTEWGNLSKACREVGVKAQSFLRWVDKEPDRPERYTRARAIGFDMEADRALDEALQADDPARGRLAFDARRWYLGKLAAKKYGDKQLLGSDPDNPLPAGITVTLRGGPVIDHVAGFLPDGTDENN